MNMIKMYAKQAPLKYKRMSLVRITCVCSHSEMLDAAFTKAGSFLYSSRICNGWVFTYSIRCLDILNVHHMIYF